MKSQEKVQDWDALAEAIREELRECAWLLRLMENQQRAIVLRDVAELHAVTAEVDSQAGQVETCRAARLAQMDLLNTADGLPRSYSLQAMTAHAPRMLQPLFQALSDEAHTLASRIQRRARQNQLLLGRATEFTAQLLEVLRPGSQVRTYNARGAVTTHSGLRGSVVRAAV